MYSFLDDDDETHQKLYNAVARCGSLVLQMGQKIDQPGWEGTNVDKHQNTVRNQGKVAEPLDAWSLSFKQFYDAVRTESLLSEFFVQDWRINMTPVISSRSA